MRQRVIAGLIDRRVEADSLLCSQAPAPKSDARLNAADDCTMFIGCLNTEGIDSDKIKRSKC